MNVRPKEGLKVRDASGRPIPAGGTSVERSRYISRRLSAGDLEVLPLAAPKAEKSKPKATKPKATKQEGGDAA